MMKKLSKILLVMALTLTVFFAMMAVASAATIESVEAGVSTDEGRPITITVTYGSPEAAQQSTVLVVKQGVQLATLQDSDIKYIDQEAVSDTTVTYTFKLLEADRVGTYDVYVGGTGIDAPNGDHSFSFDTRKIIGTISVLGLKDKATATATSPTESKSVNADSDGKYEIEVGQGTYDVVLGKAGYLYKTYEDVVVGTENVTLDAITLIPGNYILSENGEAEVINVKDITAAIQNFGQVVPEYDVNDSGAVDVIDITAAIQNFQKNY